MEYEAEKTRADSESSEGSFQLEGDIQANFPLDGFMHLKVYVEKKNYKISFNIEEDATINNVKEIILCMTGILPEYQELSFDKKDLKDDSKTLEYYNIYANSTLRLLDFMEFSKLITIQSKKPNTSFLFICLRLPCRLRKEFQRN
jgi:hypothetical protein